ncbi:hypothetical protein AC578_3989 [Pseudocercospora eumusae]|uniref:Uncharacterized protein n=1 Tax=Pseudocercospora eumusae TaxID=321146 RepID=A0A139HLY7_9PEZI|nr:hypothetical protein AC578_3989 [Pseudocercospora eumusae]
MPRSTDRAPTPMPSVDTRHREYVLNILHGFSKEVKAAENAMSEKVVFLALIVYLYYHPLSMVWESLSETRKVTLRSYCHHALLVKDVSIEAKELLRTWSSELFPDGLKDGEEAQDGEQSSSEAKRGRKLSIVMLRMLLARGSNMDISEETLPTLAAGVDQFLNSKATQDEKIDMIGLAMLSFYGSLSSQCLSPALVRFAYELDAQLEQSRLLPERKDFHQLNLVDARECPTRTFPVLPERKDFHQLNLVDVRESPTRKSPDFSSTGDSPRVKRRKITHDLGVTQPPSSDQTAPSGPVHTGDMLRSLYLMDVEFGMNTKEDRELLYSELWKDELWKKGRGKRIGTASWADAVEKRYHERVYSDKQHRWATILADPDDGDRRVLVELIRVTLRNLCSR